MLHTVMFTRLSRLACVATLAAAPLAVISLTPSTAWSQEATPATDAPATSDKPTDNVAPAENTTPAAEAGQADLDEAMVQRIDAHKPEELEEITRLLKSAISKGLSDESKSFANKMLASIQLEKAQAMAQQLAEGGGRRLRQIRQQALDSLQEAIKYDPELVEAYMLIARLNLLPEGSAEEVRKAATKAIELLANDPVEQSDAYVLRAMRQEDDKAKMEDLDAAVKADPKSAEALQGRALLRLNAEDLNGAVEDLQTLLKLDPSNQAVAQAAVEQLVKMDRIDDAVKLLSDALQVKPNEGLYRLRGIIYRTQGKEEEAKEDLDKAIAMQPRDPLSLLQRAEIYLAQNDVKRAKQDLKEAIRVAPQVADSVSAVRIRCYIAAEEGRMADAINDMKLLVGHAPDDPFWKLQLANLYLQDKRPSQAIEITNEILKQDEKNVSALRMRADTRLGIGEHVEAIKDYERALTLGIDEPTQKSGVLNNLSWVLATSPKDEIRNAEKALKYGKEAAELTEYKEAHILSTLAAAYAENGNFEEARKWSKKQLS